MTKPEVLNIKEVAALLRVAEKTAYTLAQTGELLGFKDTSLYERLALSEPGTAPRPPGAS